MSNSKMDGKEIPEHALNFPHTVIDETGKYEFDLSLIEPDSPLIHMNCNSIEDYKVFVEAGHIIKNGLWYIDDYNAVAKATAKEISIAKQYNSIAYKPRNRFELIRE